MIPAWLVISAIAVLVAFLMSRSDRRDNRWFQQLRRPDWLTFEWLIPIIWMTIFILGIWSASLVWGKAPGAGETWKLMVGYLVLELLILVYTPAMFKLRSLKLGTIIGGTGFVFGLFFSLSVWPVSTLAGWLLVPYLLWSPIGTYATWVMSHLNPESA